MIDCGEGTQRQLLRSGLGFRRLDKILLTHGHLDHIWGLGGLASTLGQWEAMQELNIYGGESAIRRVQALMEVVFGPKRMTGMGVFLNVMQPGTLFEDAKFSVTAFNVKHRGPGCFGFLFEERTRRPFLPQKAAELRVPNGPVRRDLAQGKVVTLDDGRVIQPDDVLGDPERGAKVCFVNDVSHTGPLHKAAQDADLLVIEATYMDVDSELAKKHGHITAKAAARLALKANVGQLVLHHVSRRYPTREVLAEARETFPNAIIANDFDLVQVRKGKPIKVKNMRRR